MELKKLVRGKTALTWGMLLFTVFFYSLLFFSNRIADKNTGPTEISSKTAEMGEKLTTEKMAQKEERFKANLLAHPRLASVFSLLSLFVLFLSLAVNVHWIRRISQKKPLIEGPIYFPDTSWGIFEVFQVFVGLFFVEACFLFVELLLSPWAHWSAAAKDFLIVFNGFARDVIIAFWVIFLVTRQFKEPLSTLGLTRENFFKHVRTGFLGYLGVIPFLILLLAGMAALAEALSYKPPAQAVVEIYFKESTQKFIGFFTFFVAIVGPVIEEIFFRGFAYTAARRRFGPLAAMVLTAFVFSAMHLSLIAFVPIFFLGIFLATLYEKTGSLVPSMTAHVLHNLIMVCLTLGFKQLSV